MTYPLAGWLGTLLGLGPALLVMAALGVGGVLAALWLWPRRTKRDMDKTAWL